MTETNEIKKRERRDRKEEILIKATELFGTYGFRGTSLASIAQGVGLTEPGLLHYFSSKVDLLQRVLEYRDKKDVERLMGEFSPESQPLFNGFKRLIANNEKKPVMIRLFTVLVGESIRQDHPSHDYFKDRYTNTRKKIVENLSILSEAGEIKQDVNIEKVATLIIAILDGLQIQWLLHPEEVSMSESFDLFSKILQSYLS
ncbi:MAG: TetR/AcrR family transcriptional regulator [Chloroflexi bacterium]|nr:TetR/AcrR family transcriptional regulator [Chloroflexota bacterium]